MTPRILRGVTATATATALCLVASSALAQLAPSISGFSDAPITATEGQYWGFVSELGYCLARTKNAKAVALAATRAGSADEASAFKALFNANGNNTCMRNMVNATVVRGQVRGAVEEGLYKMRPDLLSRTTAPAGLVAPPAIVNLRDFADCHVAGHYGETRRLLTETRLGTKEESEQVALMSKDFGVCLPQGLQVRLKAMNVRLALAGALYRAAIGLPQLAQGDR